MNPLALVPNGQARRGRCLGPLVTAYADRAMDADSLRHWDRHVVVCTCCRAAVEAERRVLASLRSNSASAVPGDLRGMLLAVASSGAPEDDGPGESQQGSPIPPVPIAPVPVVDRGMPAFHRSARRAAAFAGLAAGATAAAAWSLALTGGAVATPGPNPTITPETVQRTRPATPGYAPAVFTVSSAGFLSRVAAPSTGDLAQNVRPGVGRTRPRSAESTP